MFKQDMFHYKYNLVLPNFKWTGTKAVRKKEIRFSSMAQKYKR